MNFLILMSYSGRINNNIRHKIEYLIPVFNLYKKEHEVTTSEMCDR